MSYILRTNYPSTRPRHVLNCSLIIVWKTDTARKFTLTSDHTKVYDPNTLSIRSFTKVSINDLSTENIRSDCWIVSIVSLLCWVSILYFPQQWSYSFNFTKNQNVPRSYIFSIWSYSFLEWLYLRIFSTIVFSDMIVYFQTWPYTVSHDSWPMIVYFSKIVYWIWTFTLLFMIVYFRHPSVFIQLINYIHLGDMPK